MTTGLMPTTVPEGSFAPQISAPPSGTTLSRGKDTAGWHRMASFRTHCLFGYGYELLDRVPRVRMERGVEKMAYRYSSSRLSAYVM